VPLPTSESPKPAQPLVRLALGGSPARKLASALLAVAASLVRSDREPGNPAETSKVREKVEEFVERGTEEVVSAEIPDWSREVPHHFYDPGRKLLIAIRGYQRWQARKGIISNCFRKWFVLRYRFWSLVTASDIGLRCNIGGGLLIPHPNGIHIHPDAIIGVNCLIFQQVTIGSRRGERGVPVIEGHVDIGAGAKILGPVRIGAHARIDANAVVQTNVPSRAMAFGIPAKILRFQSD